MRQGLVVLHHGGRRGAQSEQGPWGQKEEKNMRVCVCFLCVCVFVFVSIFCVFVLRAFSRAQMIRGRMPSNRNGAHVPRGRRV